MFIPNGLLGGETSSSTADELNGVASTNSGVFVPNGLLGTPAKEVEKTIQESTDDVPATFSFTSNGLLGSRTSQNLPQPTSSTSNFDNNLLEVSAIKEKDSSDYSPTTFSFTGNGLPDPSNSRTSHNSLESISSTSHLDNGLLGISPTKEVEMDHQEPTADEIPTTFSFTSNGLLGSSSSKTSQNSLGTASGISSLDIGMSFTSNGLLGSASSTSSLDTGMTFTSNGLLSQSQDELPSILSDACPPTRSITEFPIASTSTFTPCYSVRAVNFDGKTIYLKKKQKRTTQDTRTTTSQQMGNLLDIPVHRMMDELSKDTITQIQQTNQAENSSTATNDPVEDTLWVDRYRPQKFTELMGNERVARETMTWVKQWDWCVFGKKLGKKRPRDAENIDEQDEYHRPREKMLLLSGPPGLGKTTLAHVVARQAGYEVMEINASDARSGHIVDDRIRPTLESGSAVGSTKPVLLIIDEIDGATGAGDNSATFVHKLVQLTQDKPWRKQRRGQKRDPHVKRPILRPIICICNDANASSLAKLRPVVYHVRFSRPSDIHVVKRLREICTIESLKTETRALSALVGIARGDLRGCLNTLQFIKARKEEVTEVMIRKATAGMKEAESSVLTILNNLFSPMTKKRVKELGINEEEEGRYVARLSQEVDGSGRESAIAAGCFAHYANLKQHDASFSRYEKAMEWLLTFDCLSAAMYSDGDFALIPYVPYNLVAFYPLFKERGNPRVERDHTDWEQMQVTRSNEEIYKSLSLCLRSAAVHQSGDFRYFATYPILQLEFTPYINRIISPPLRPVNSQVIRPEEKTALKRLIDIMAAVGLRFVQERSEDGQLSYRIDPAIDVFVTYDGKRASDILVSRYATRHLVAQEIDARVSTREVEFVEKGKQAKDSLNPFSSFKKNVSQAATVEDQSTEGKEPLRKRAKTNNVDIADRPPTDFFGRPIALSNKPMSKAQKGSSVVKKIETKFRVSFRYVEGNSAAVRKPMKISAFL